MGWTSFHINTTATTDQVLRREFSQDSQNGTRPAWDVIESATVGAQWYAIICRTDYDTSTPDGSTAERRTYYGLICLTERRNTNKRQGMTEFFYKDMDESMGPHACAMPARMLARLEQLAPNAQGYAASWRESVKQHHARKAAKAKAKREARAQLARFISDHFQVIHVRG